MDSNVFVTYEFVAFLFFEFSFAVAKGILFAISFANDKSIKFFWDD